MSTYDTAQRADAYFKKVLEAPEGKWVRVTLHKKCKASRRKTWEQLLLLLDLFGQKYETPKSNHFSIRRVVPDPYRQQILQMVDDFMDPLGKSMHEWITQQYNNMRGVNK